MFNISSVDDPYGWGMDVIPNYDGVEADTSSQRYPIDAGEGRVMDQFTLSKGESDRRPWYARAVELGISGAMDAISPRPVASGSQMPSYAGQNGRTYTMPNAANGAPAATAGVGGLSVPMLALLGGLAFLASR
jgi:hypothetical protein